MPLPKRMTEKELIENGFTKISDRKAKHNRYRSYRYKCRECGCWTNNDINGVCRKCERGNMEVMDCDKELDKIIDDFMDEFIDDAINGR